VSLDTCQVLGARTRGILVKGSSVVRVAGCTIRPRPGDAGYRAAVSVDAACRQVLVVDNFVARGSDGDVLLALPEAAYRAGGNLTL